MSTQTGQIVRGTLILAGALLAIGWVIVLSVKRAEDPARMVFKWILTVIILGVMFRFVAPIVAQGGYGGAFMGIPLTAVCGLALAIVWRYHLASLIARPFASLYDGGDVPAEPRPAYSVALARQKKGLYAEAIAEIWKQLERFPADFEGQMLLAQIQAENLQDLSAAENTVERLVTQPGHAPKNIVFALYSLADWQLKFGRDRDAAHRALQRVIDLLPDSEFSLGAAQRIGHLSEAEMRLAAEPKKFVVTEGIQNVGLARNYEPVKLQEKTPAQLANEYVKHLELHPLDTEAREQLAIIYLDHYGRLDLATDQLEQMIQQPNQPGRLVARWLNLLADLQIRGGCDYETIRQTLQRIVDRDPKVAAAETARHRIDRLKLELKAKTSSQTVPLGAYEQNIGLKRASARGFPAE
jgi:tetratricopeptide (TPR) repeat protein